MYTPLICIAALLYVLVGAGTAAIVSFYVGYNERSYFTVENDCRPELSFLFWTVVLLGVVVYFILARPAIYMSALLTRIGRAGREYRKSRNIKS